MRFATPVCSFVAALLLTTPVGSQNVNIGNPQEINVQHHPSPEEIRDRLSVFQVQKDAKELAEICALVTTDMDSVKQGLLPKDVTDKLKRLEKLSKRMRENLTRASADH
jgi:hypothetical protein